MFFAHLQATATGPNTWEELSFNIIMTINVVLVKMQNPGPWTNPKQSASLGILHFTSFPGDRDAQ